MDNAEKRRLCNNSEKQILKFENEKMEGQTINIKKSCIP